MRTTLVLDDDIHGLVTALARARRVSLGTVVSELARAVLRRPVGMTTDRGWPVFDLPPEAPLVTAEQVQAVLDDEGEL